MTKLCFCLFAVDYAVSIIRIVYYFILLNALFILSLTSSGFVIV